MENINNIINFAVAAGLVILAVVAIAKSATIVPQQEAFVVQTMGKYRKTLEAGFHLLIPFLDKVAAKHTLKEQSAHTDEQTCITKDNVQVKVDGVIYVQVLHPRLATYGIESYVRAIVGLAQTTLRSEIGKIELDRTFEARATINANVVEEVDKASAAWGVKVLRYEILNISPPTEVLQAMEKQMRAEREKRAAVLTSEGERDAAINRAEGEKQRVIMASEAEQAKQINEAQGEAEAITAIASATAQGLRAVAQAVSEQGGTEAMQLRVAEQYVEQFGQIAKAGNTLVVPANLGDVSSMIALATRLAREGKTD